MSGLGDSVQSCDKQMDMEANTENDKVHDDLQDNVVVSPTQINSLTDDCMRFIFNLMPMSELIFFHEVCTRWKTVISNVLHAHVEVTLFKRNYEIMGIDVNVYERDCLEGNNYPPLGSAKVEMPDFDWNSQDNFPFDKIYNRLPVAFSTTRIRKLEIRGVTFPSSHLGNFLCHLTNLEHLSIFLDNLPYKKSVYIAHQVITLATQTRFLRHLMITLGGNNTNDIRISNSDLRQLYIKENVLENLESLYICDYSNSWFDQSIIKLNQNVLFGKLRHLAVAHNRSLFNYLSHLGKQEDICESPKLSALLSLTHLTLHHNKLYRILAISLTPFVCLKKLSVSFSFWPTREDRNEFILSYLRAIPESLKHFCLNIVPHVLTFDLFPLDFVKNRYPPIQSFEIIEIECSHFNNVDVELHPLLDVFKNWSKLRVNEKHYVADENEPLGYRLSNSSNLAPNIE